MLPETLNYDAFTLNGFNDQERNMKFVKTNFQVLKLKFHACSFKQAFYPLHKLYLFSDRDNTKIYFYISFSFDTWLSNLRV